MLFRFGSAPRDKVGPGSRRPCWGGGESEGAYLAGRRPRKSPRTLKNLRRRERPRSHRLEGRPLRLRSDLRQLRRSDGPGRMAAPSMSSTCRARKTRRHYRSWQAASPALRRIRARRLALCDPPKLANAVDVIDPATRKVLVEIPTGEPQSHMLVISPDGYRGLYRQRQRWQRQRARPGQAHSHHHNSRSQRASSAFPFRRMANAFSLMIRMRHALPLSIRPQTRSQPGSSCRVRPYASASTPDGRWLLAVGMTAKSRARRRFAVDESGAFAGYSRAIVRSPDSSRRGYRLRQWDPAPGKIAVLDLRSWKRQAAYRPDSRPSTALPWLPASH